MKKLLFLALVILLALTLVACGGDMATNAGGDNNLTATDPPGGNITPTGVPIEKPITIIIERQIDLHEHENGGKEIIITNIATVNEIHELFLSLTFESTSAPMVFPRYVITFRDEYSESFTWYIDENNTASLRGIGNATVVNSDNFYQQIEKLIMSEQNKALPVVRVLIEDDGYGDTAMEFIYEDEYYRYYLSSIRSNFIMLTFEDGLIISLANALYQQKISMSDLILNGLNVHIKPAH